MAAETGPDRRQFRPARVHHAELWGLRQRKYAWLQEHDRSDTDWQEITPHPEFYLFVPRDEAALERYNQFAKVTDIFPVHSVGIVTARDRFVIDFDRDALERRIRQFRDPSVSGRVLRDTYRLHSTSSWDMAKARKAIQRDDSWRDKITRCLYRPFDRRWLFYHYDAIDRGREDVMRHMLAGQNLALITRRQMLQGRPYYVFVTDMPAADGVIRSDNKGSESLFPLTLFAGSSPQDLFAQLDEPQERPNLAEQLPQELRSAYLRQPMPEQVLHYIYAVLYAPSYRDKYAEFLKIDFPRVPFTADPELFAALAELGERLVGLHLLNSPELDPPLARFHGEGDDCVARRKRDGFRYEPDAERVHINPDQYFAPVAPELWEYQIGGYQVLHKWLKDRRDRRLSTDEIKTYCRIVTAIQRTIEVQEEIDALYPKAEREIVELELPEV